MAQNYDLTQTGPELQARIDQVYPNRDAIEQETETRETQDESLETSLKEYTDTEQARAEAAEGALDTRVSANEVDIDLLKSQYKALTQSDIIVGPLPSTGQPNKIYRVPGSTYYTDYMWANGGWVKLAEYSTLDGYVYKGIATPTGTPVQSAEAVFYFAIQPGTYTNYGGLVVTNTIAILKFNGTEWTKDDLIAIDDEPTAGSENLITSGAVAASVVYDISAANAVGGQLATYADLAAALNGGENIPADIRKGGMSIKFVQSSDNKYVQYRLMSDTFNTTPANWQGVDDGIIVGSQSLAKSGVLNGMVIKEPAFTNGFIDTHNVYHENNDYRCSDFLPLDLMYSIILNDTGSLESKTMNFCLYDKDKNLVRSPVINFADINDVFVINKETYPQVYFRFWGKTEVIQLITLKWIGSKVYELNDDVESLKEVTPEIQVDILQLKHDFSNLEERLYVDIIGDFENGFVDNSGHPHDSDSYSRSKHIKSSDVSRIIIRDDNATAIQINLFQTDDWTAPVGKILNLGKDIDLQTAIAQFSNANYFVIWFNESSPSVANEYTDFIPLHLGDIQELQKDVDDLQEDIENLSAKKSPSGLIYHNSCKFVDDFIAADKGNDYQNISSSITVVQSGISIPYGAGKWTWVNKDVRNSKKTHIIDFIPNGCTSIKIASFGFRGGANGINEGIYFNIDISNNVISCSNGQSASFSFTNNGKYRVYLYQEDKHTELSVIDLKSGSKSVAVYYNGKTANNDGLFYDTWALNPIGASLIIIQYEIFAYSKKPFLSIFGDSITLGFNATVSEGLNHNKFAYLVGESTNREYTVTGRGGASFAVLYGSTIQGIPNLSSVKFDGMLYSELPAYMSSYVMLTMGTNGGGTYNQYKEFVEYVLSLGLIPIVNTLPIRADGQDDKNIPANVAANEAIMQIWKDYNIHGARFDLATSLNNDGETIDTSLYIDDMIHPNDAGHAAMAARVMLDCPELFY